MTSVAIVATGYGHAHDSRGASMTKAIRYKRALLALLTVGAIAGGAYAFTAANTVPASTAGAGSGAVTGYTVSGLHYALNATTSASIDSLAFTVSPVIPSTGTGKVTVQVALTTGGPSVYTCTTNTAGDTVTCPTTSPVLLADKLSSVTVVAAQ
jgi:hypothetical protein